MPGKTVSIDTRGRGFFAALALTALLFAWTAVGPCLDNGFINWDETLYILNNPKIKTLTPAGVRTIFTSRDLELYSPLSTLSYAVNYRFSGLSPKGYHAAAIALHLANTLLVMFLVRLLLPGVWPAFLCGLFFGVHPAHVESVAWAAERKDLLYAFFYLLALCAYARGLGRGDRWKYYAAALGLFACSLLSKPMAVTLPLALLLIDCLKLEKLRLRDWLNKAPFFIAAAVFSAAAMPAADAAAQWAPFSRRLAVAVYNLGFYVYTLVWPFNLSAMYVRPLGGERLIYAAAACVAAAAGALLFYCRRNRTVLFGAGFYAAMLLPVLQFFPFGPVISADRYTYLSSLGIFIAAAAAGAGVWARAGEQRRKILAVLIALAALGFTVAARVRCAVWKDSVTLWTDTLHKQPAAGPALVSLCSAYLQGGLEEQAAACLGEAIRRYPGKDDNYYNLGLLLFKKGDYTAARKYFERTLELNGGHAKALLMMGHLALLNRDSAAAERFCLRSLESDGADAPALRILAGIAAARGDIAGALEYYGRALAVDPADLKTREAAAALRGRR